MKSNRARLAPLPMEKILVIKYATANGHAGFLTDDNSGREKQKIPFNVSKKFSGVGVSPGAMFSVKVDEDGESISYRKGARPVALWHNCEDVKEWRALHIAEAASKTAVKVAQVNTLIEGLAPIRAAYRSAGYKQRTALLAEIIRIITT